MFIFYKYSWVVCSQTCFSPETGDRRGGTWQWGGVWVHDPLLSPCPAPHHGTTCCGEPTSPKAVAASASIITPDTDPSLHTQLTVFKTLNETTSSSTSTLNDFGDCSSVSIIVLLLLLFVVGWHWLNLRMDLKCMKPCTTSRPHHNKPEIQVFWFTNLCHESLLCTLIKPLCYLLLLKICVISAVTAGGKKLTLTSQFE